MSVILAAAIVVYARASGYGFFSDDFGWLLGAKQFSFSQLFVFTTRDHFYRPVVGLYFPIVMPLCGRSPACYHWLGILTHALTATAAALMARGLSGSSLVGSLTGVLFALQPAPVEAVIWVSAIGEVLSTLFSVLTVWFYWLAITRRARWAYFAACFAFTAALLSHESAVTLSSILFLFLLLFPVAEFQRPLSKVTHAIWRLAPFLAITAAYGVIAYIINSRNYVVTEGHTA